MCADDQRGARSVTRAVPVRRRPFASRARSRAVTRSVPRRASSDAADRVRVTRRTCRFLTDSGRLTKAVKCGAPLSVVAKGKRAWSLKFGSNAPRGRYTVRAVSIDRAGNLSKPVTSSVKIG